MMLKRNFVPIMQELVSGVIFLRRIETDENLVNAL